MKKLIQLNSLCYKNSITKNSLNSISNFNKSNAFKTFCDIKKQSFKDKWSLRKFGKIGTVVYLTTSVVTFTIAYMLIKYDYIKKQIITDYLKKKGVDVDHYIEKLGGEKKINFILAYLCVFILKPFKLIFSCAVAGAMIQTNKDLPKVKDVREMISRRRAIIAERIKNKKTNFSEKFASQQLKKYHNIKGRFNSSKKNIITRFDKLNKFNKKKFSTNINKNQPKKGILAKYGKRGFIIYTAYWFSSGLFFYYLIRNKYIDKEIVEKKMVDYPWIDKYYKGVKEKIGDRNTDIALAFMITELFEVFRLPTFILYMRYTIAKSS